MKYYYKYLGLFLSIGLNIYGYIVLWQVNTIETRIHEHINFFYYSKTVIGPNINPLTLLASLGLFLTLILIFLKKNIWKHFFAVLTLISLTPFIQLWNNNYYMGLGVIKLEIITLVILIIHLELNPDVISDMKSFLNIKPIEENRPLNENLIEIFESKFGNFTVSELNKIVSGNKHVNEAKEAAKRLLKLK